MRNALLTIATAAVLVIGFFSYQSLTRIERDNDFGESTTLSNFEQDVSAKPEEIMRVDMATGGELQLPPGTQPEFTLFDEFTGRPIQKFRCASWTKVPNTRNDVEVTEPELTLYSQNLEISIAADAGQLGVDELDRKRLRPRKGWLEGNVKLAIRHDPSAKPGTAPEQLDGITILLDRLQFDLMHGVIEAAGKLDMTSPIFDLRGRGLRLVWNDIDRRIDTLQVHEGEQLSFRIESDPLGGAVGQQPPEQPEEQTDEADAGRVTAYAAALMDNVEATHYRGDQPVGKLTCASLHLLFDVPSGSSRAWQQQPADETQDEEAPAAPVAANTPADAVDEEAAQPERLVVRWSGPLKLAPRESRKPDGPLRRHIDARGEEVRIELGNGTTIQCGRLLYREEQRRLWLHAQPDGPVAMDISNGPRVRARSVFLDRDAGIVKLLGDLAVSNLTNDAGSESLSIGCRLWAELHLVRDDAEPAEVSESGSPIDVSDMGTVESAVFVGHVRTDLEGGRSLRAHRLVTHFEPAPPAPPTSQPAQPATPQPTLVQVEQPEPEAAPAGPDEFDASSLRLVKAVASGGVTLLSADEGLRATWMQIDFEQDAATQRPVPTQLDARGDIRLQNPDQGVYAHGRELKAYLLPDTQLDRAVITGDRSRPAFVAAADYKVRGRQIDIDLEPELPNGTLPFHMRVPGNSQLTFMSQRGLQGQMRRRAEPVVVNATQTLEFDSDDKLNQVRFIGDVVARSGEERLEADTLTLYLQDTPVETELTPRATLTQLFTRLTDQALGRESRNESLLAGGTRVRKDARRMVAQHATLISETFVPGRAQPVVMQQISAPELTLEIPQRTVRTIGETVLGMTSLRLPTAGQTSEGTGAIGLPSAMISRGPSQTALLCKGSMRYTFGDDGGSRGDTVLFEGGVRFRHKAGKAMHRLNELLPEVARDPQLIAQLKDRNTYLECSRLELLLAVQEIPGGPQQGRRSPQLSWLNATGDVWLRDQQGAGIREVQANQIEFDRDSKTVRVLGNPAQVEYMNRETNRYEKPAVGPAFTVYLDSNTVKAEKVSGEINR